MNQKFNLNPQIIGYLYNELSLYGDQTGNIYCTIKWEIKLGSFGIGEVNFTVLCTAPM